MHHLVIDVEATGGSSMTHSMIQLGAVDLNGNEFYAEMRPMAGRDIDPAALEAIGLSEETIRKYPDPAKSTKDFHRWLRQTYYGERITTWSDNPAFDWQFVNGYLWLYMDSNPMGWSMRRIGDFYAGKMGDVTAASKWKRLRDTPHTHNALDDAKGNAEALKKIMRM